MSEIPSVLRLVVSQHPRPRYETREARWHGKNLEEWARELDSPDDTEVIEALGMLSMAAAVWSEFDPRDTMQRCAPSLRRLLNRDDGPVYEATFEMVSELTIACYDDAMWDAEEMVEVALAKPAGPRRRAAAKRLTFLPWDAFGLG